MLLQARRKYHPGYRVWLSKIDQSLLISPDDGKTFYGFASGNCSMLRHPPAEFVQLFACCSDSLELATELAASVEITDQAYSGEHDAAASAK